MASERDSGFEKAERSTSSGQGRRRERPWRRERKRWLAKVRRAGVGAEATAAAIGIWDWGLLETGRMAGEDDGIVGNMGRVLVLGVRYKWPETVGLPENRDCHRSRPTEFPKNRFLVSPIYVGEKRVA